MATLLRDREVEDCRIGDVENTHSRAVEPAQEVVRDRHSQAQPEEIERNARINAVWLQMNRGISTEKLKSILNKPSAAENRTIRNTSPQTSSASWMKFLGLAPKKTPSLQDGIPAKRPTVAHNSSSKEAKKIAAAALSAAKEGSSLTMGSTSGKVEITEIRDFAGEEVEVKKLVDAHFKEALDKSGRGTGGVAPSAVDAVLEQIRKKPKLSVLDKTKMDWGEFKEDNKGLEEELESYKKSGDQYLEKVSFLQRADYREFERERDSRLALQAKRRPPDS